jgi:hypothetical protein
VRGGHCGGQLLTRVRTIDVVVEMVEMVVDVVIDVAHRPPASCVAASGRHEVRITFIADIKAQEREGRQQVSRHRVCAICGRRP